MYRRLLTIILFIFGILVLSSGMIFFFQNFFLGKTSNQNSPVKEEFNLFRKSREIKVYSELGNLNISLSDQGILQQYAGGDINLWQNKGNIDPKTGKLITVKSVDVIFVEDSGFENPLVLEPRIKISGSHVTINTPISKDLIKQGNFQEILKQAQFRILWDLYLLSDGQIDQNDIAKFNGIYKDFSLQDKQFLNVKFENSTFKLIPEVLAQSCTSSYQCGAFTTQNTCQLAGNICTRNSDCLDLPGDQCIASLGCEANITIGCGGYSSDENLCKNPECGTGECRIGNCTWNPGGVGGTPPPGSTPTPAPGATPAPQTGECTGGNRCYNDWICCASGCPHTWDEGYAYCSSIVNPPPDCGSNPCPPPPPPPSICDDTKTCANGTTQCGPGKACRSDGEGGWNCQIDKSCFDCSISVNPKPIYVQTGTSLILNANVSKVRGGELKRVKFVSSNTGKVTATSPDGTSPFESTITGIASGSPKITAKAEVSNDDVVACENEITTYVYDQYVSGWWQASGADITSNGSINSIIPLSCTAAKNCIPQLIRDENPGVVIYGTSYDFQEGPGQGSASDTGWLANATSNTKIYDYAYFSKMAPKDTVWNEVSGSVTSSKFKNNVTKSPDGYYWFKSVGDLTVTGKLTMDSGKIIIFVEGGDLTFAGDVNIGDLGQDFIMAIAGKDANGDKGNIKISPGVVKVEGVFVTDNQFLTGIDNKKLDVQGSVVAWGGVDMQRDLGPVDNQYDPAEIFVYQPEIAIMFPQSLTDYDINWKEVVP